MPGDEHQIARALLRKHKVPPNEQRNTQKVPNKRCHVQARRGLGNHGKCSYTNLPGGTNLNLYVGFGSIFSPEK